jgi:dTDP-glucose 4,6-dehydratase
VLNDGSPGEVYNIGSGYYLNNNDLAEKILVFFNESKAKLNYIKDRKGHDFRYSLDCEKLKNMGFEVRLDFDSALEETIVWYRNNVGIAK